MERCLKNRAPSRLLSPSFRKKSIGRLAGCDNERTAIRLHLLDLISRLRSFVRSFVALSLSFPLKRDPRLTSFLPFFQVSPCFFRFVRKRPRSVGRSYAFSAGGNRGRRKHGLLGSLLDLILAKRTFVESLRLSAINES